MHSRLTVLVFALTALGSAVLPAGASATFTPLGSFSSLGPGAGQIGSAGGIESGDNGGLYVADSESNRVDAFALNGAFQLAFGGDVNPASMASEPDICTSTTGCQQGGAGAAAGEILEPEDVAIAPSGNVYVADFGNNRIDVYTAKGEFVSAFGADVGGAGIGACTTATTCAKGTATTGEAGQISGPHGLAIVGEEIYVSDGGFERIDVFSFAGAFHRALGAAVGAGGKYVCTTTCSPGEGGEGAGELGEPAGISYDAATGLLSVADIANARVDQIAGEGFVRAFGEDVGGPGLDVCTTATTCVKGGTAAGPASLLRPVAVSAASGGNLLVADFFGNRVAEFTATGAFVRAFGEGVATGASAFEICSATCLKGGAGTGFGSTPGPVGVGLDAVGRIAVVESGTNFARIGFFGDFVEPEEPAEPAPTPPAPTPPPATILPAPRPIPSNRVTFGKLKLDKKTGAAVLFVITPGSGELILTGAGVRKVNRSTPEAGPVKLPVNPTGATKKKLRKSGVAKVKLQIAFTPTEGSVGNTMRSVKLKEAQPR